MQTQNSTESRFDESGQYLLALSESRLTIHDIDNETIVASTLTHATETLDVRFTKKANAFVEVGRNFVRLWSVKGSDMSFKEVDMSSMENVSCCSRIKALAFVVVKCSQFNVLLFLFT